jgi:hypothetical protein
MNCQSELIETTKINVKELSDLRKCKSTLSLKVAENDKCIIKIRAEWAEDVDYWKG